MKSDDFPLLLVSIDLTSKCNLNCKHCGSISVEDKNELTINEIRDVIKEISGFKPERIVFSGGEPLLKKGIFDLLEYTHELGINTYMPSNGTLITSDIAKKLKKVNLGGIVISLDGNEEIHDKIRGKKGTFEKAINAIKYLVDEGLKVTIKLTVMKWNMDQYKYLVDLTKELGVEEFALKRYIPAGKMKVNKKELLVAPEEYKEVVDKAWVYAQKKGIKMMSRDPVIIPYLYKEKIENKYKDKLNDEILGGCLAGISICNIDNKGNVSPCGFVPKFAGNIRKDYFSDIWNNSSLFKKLRKRDCLKGKCKFCKYINLCGGCRAMAYSLKGDIFEEDPYCFFNV